MDAVDGYYITYMKLFSLSLYSLHLFTALHEATAQDSYCSTYHIEVPLHQVTIISSARCSFFIPQHFLKSVCSCVFFVFVLKSCSHHRGRDTHTAEHTHTHASVLHSNKARGSFSHISEQQSMLHFKVHRPFTRVKLLEKK